MTNRLVVIYLLMIVCISPVLAQTDGDILKASYTHQIVGTWVRQNQVIDGRGDLPDTTVTTYDTLVFYADQTYYQRLGVNAEKKWAGSIERGTWAIVNIAGSSRIAMHERTSNIPLPLVDYAYDIVSITDYELSFIYYKHTFTYSRRK